MQMRLFHMLQLQRPYIFDNNQDITLPTDRAF